MNLIEARKQAHEGWVRSDTRTCSSWVQVVYYRLVYESGDEIFIGSPDLDAEDWEPKPKPGEPFEAEVWVCQRGELFDIAPCYDHADWERPGWRRIRVREVT